MDVVFYTFAKKDNSTKRPAGGTTFNCVLKDSSGVLSPEIEISTTGNPRSYNYAYIPDFGRYYYVAEWTYYRGVWIGSLRVDALASWKNDIGAANLYILRSADERIKNEWIVDRKYLAMADVMNSYVVSEQNPWNGATIVLGVLGDASHGQGMGAANYYALRPDQMKVLCNWLFGNTGGYSDAIDAVFSYVFDETTRLNLDPIQYFTSARYFPFEITNDYITQTSMIVGKIPKTLGAWINDLKMLTPMPTQTWGPVTFTIPGHPQAIQRGRYLQSPPYSHYKLHFEPFGMIEIDGSMLDPGGTLTCTGITDLLTGKSLLYLKATDSTGTAEVELGTYNAEVGCQVQLAQITTNFIQNLKTQIGNFVQAAANDNVLGMLDAGLSTMTETRYQLSASGCDGSILPYAIHNPVLHLYYRNVVHDDPEHYGYPACRKDVLSSHPGFLLCAEGDIDTAATLAEKETIKNALTTGFFYE